jgi:hypothetical protein
VRNPAARGTRTIKQCSSDARRQRPLTRGTEEILISAEREGEKAMDEMEEGKQKFLEVVKGTDAAVQVVIPVTPSNSMFLISLTKGPNRKFITVSEDDIIDLPNEASILSKVTKTVKDAVSAL